MLPSSYGHNQGEQVVCLSTSTSSLTWSLRSGSEDSLETLDPRRCRAMSAVVYLLVEVQTAW